MKKLFSILLLFFSYAAAFAQSSSSTVEMADKLRADGKIYVVITVFAIILTGIFTYIIMLDRKIGKLEKELKNK